MGMTGELRTFSFADIFQIILSNRKSGLFIIEWEDINTVSYVKDGEIIFTRPVDKIYKVYSEKEFDSVIEKLRIPKQNMYKTVERFLLSRLDRRDGRFSLVDRLIIYDSDYPVVYTIEALTMMSARLLEPEEVSRKISEDMLTLELSNDYKQIAEKAKLNPQEAKVLSLIDGEKTVFDIRKEAKLDSLTVDRSLYGFLALGIAKRKKKERKQKPNVSLELLVKIIKRVKEV